MSSRTFIPCRVCGASHTNPMSSSICEPCGISERQKNQAERRQEARMSDDLVKRLRDLGDHASFEPHMHHTAADRIEELEAELRNMALDCLAAKGQAAEAYQAQLAAEAKAVDAMEEVATYSNDPHLVKWSRAALKELEDKTDE